MPPLHLLTAHSHSAFFSFPSPTLHPSSSPRPPFPPFSSLPCNPIPSIYSRIRLTRTQDVAALLLRALRRSNEVTLLAPSPDAAKAELPDGSPLVKSKKAMRRLLRYCLVLGRLVSYTNLVEDPAGTKYPTIRSGRRLATAGGNGQRGRGVYSAGSPAARAHGHDAPHTMSTPSFRFRHSLPVSPISLPSLPPPPLLPPTSSPPSPPPLPWPPPNTPRTLLVPHSSTFLPSSCLDRGRIAL
ncbi:unnamed protein product [Closterium sp. NIES-65]|nr:unnamed protein product [Closterium sp. NIES-65]